MEHAVCVSVLQTECERGRGRAEKVDEYNFSCLHVNMEQSTGDTFLIPSVYCSTTLQEVAQF